MAQENKMEIRNFVWKNVLTVWLCKMGKYSNGKEMEQRKKIVKLKKKREKTSTEMRWDATTLHFAVRILQRFCKLDKSDMPYSRVTQRGWKVIIWILRIGWWWTAMEKWMRRRRSRKEIENDPTYGTNGKEFNNKIRLFILFRLLFVCVWESISIHFATTINVVSGNRYFSIKKFIFFSDTFLPVCVGYENEKEKLSSEKMSSFFFMSLW